MYVSLKEFSKSRNVHLIENSNIDSTCLSRRKLHLIRKGVSRLALNFKKVIIQNERPENCNIIQDLRVKHPNNIIISYIINSIRNKLNDLNFVLHESVDVLTVAETKLDPSFPTSQFILQGYKHPYRLDVTDVVVVDS